MTNLALTGWGCYTDGGVVASVHVGKDVGVEGIARRAVHVGTESLETNAFAGGENVGVGGDARHAMIMGKETGRSEVACSSTAQPVVPTENVAMDELHHVQLTHANQPPTLRHWKHSARRGGVEVPKVAVDSNKKRKGALSEVLAQ
jgi:hypothetical protein